MFVLIHPPFAALERPNLGLSLLKSCLTREGIPARVYYANHDLAVDFGINDYNATHFDAEAMLGDWLFSGLFRKDGWDWSFLEWLQNKGYRKDLIAALGQATRQLPAYVEKITLNILAWGPTVVGCSSTFQQNAASLALLRSLKSHRSELPTVMGGANLQGEMGKPILSFPWVDYVVVGEAEDCVAGLYREAARLGSQIPAERLPAPVASRKRAFRVRGTRTELDSLPYPDFDDYFESLRNRPELQAVQPILTLEGSRGCWWGQVSHCNFRGLNGTGLNYRAKSPARLQDEILHLSTP